MKQFEVVSNPNKTHDPISQAGKIKNPELEPFLQLWAEPELPSTSSWNTSFAGVVNAISANFSGFSFKTEKQKLVLSVQRKQIRRTAIRTGEIAAFILLDVNMDGNLQRVEFAHFLYTLMRHSGESELNKREMWQILDADGSTGVDLREFVEFQSDIKLNDFQSVYSFWCFIEMVWWLTNGSGRDSVLGAFSVLPLISDSAICKPFRARSWRFVRIDYWWRRDAIVA